MCRICERRCRLTDKGISSNMRNQMRRLGLQLQLRFSRRGGARAGAGRKRVGARANVPHRRREPHDPRHPVHLTLRAVALPCSLRTDRVWQAVNRAIRAASHSGFRVLEFSLQPITCM